LSAPIATICLVGFARVGLWKATPAFPRSGIPATPCQPKSSKKQFLLVCLEGHSPYKTGCNKRCTNNTGCPVCGIEKCRVPHHPVVPVGRPDLAGEWDPGRNTELHSEVTLGGHYRAWGVCSSNPEHSRWQTTVQNRALLGNDCSACRSRNKVKPRLFGPTGL